VKKIAVVGSRLGVNPQDVALRVNAYYQANKDFILVSGGSEGTCRVAEATAIEFGLPVISFRIAGPLTYGTDDFFRVDEWRMHRGQGAVIEGEITWKDWQSATNHKALLIAERAEEATAFHAAGSRGTAFEIEMFAAAGVPCEAIRVG
jgi:hypothetical protein